MKITNSWTCGEWVFEEIESRRYGKLYTYRLTGAGRIHERYETLDEAMAAAVATPWGPLQPHPISKGTRRSS